MPADLHYVGHVTMTVLWRVLLTFFRYLYNLAKLPVDDSGTVGMQTDIVALILQPDSISCSIPGFLSLLRFSRSIIWVPTPEEVDQTWNDSSVCQHQHCSSDRQTDRKTSLMKHIQTLKWLYLWALASVFPQKYVLLQLKGLRNSILTCS